MKKGKHGGFGFGHHMHEGAKGKFEGRGPRPMHEGFKGGGFFGKFKGRHDDGGTTGRPMTTSGDAAKNEYEAHINGLGDSDFPMLSDVQTFGPAAGAAVAVVPSASMLGGALALAGVIGGLYLLSCVLPLGRR